MKTEYINGNFEDEIAKESRIIKEKENELKFLAITQADKEKHQNSQKSSPNKSIRHGMSRSETFITAFK